MVWAGALDVFLGNNRCTSLKAPVAAEPTVGRHTTSPSTPMAESEVAVTHRDAHQKRKTHFVPTRVENWKCSTLTAFHAWHTSEAIPSDNVIEVSGGPSVLFCLLYYEDGAVSKWTVRE